jgi:hypothetical protein
MLNAPKYVVLNTTPDHNGLHEKYCVHCKNSLIIHAANVSSSVRI